MRMKKSEKSARMEKKAVALVSVLAMSMGMTSSVFAAETKMASKPAEYNAVMKTYDLHGTNNAGLYPVEALEFVSTPKAGNPASTNLAIDTLQVAGNQGQLLSIHVPSYTEVGMYHYTLSEVSGGVQGVTYSQETVDVSVLVTYDYEDADQDGYYMTAEVGITQGSEGEKKDTFTNTYDVGSLLVTKEVTGNMGDREKYFDVDVKFTAEEGKKVASAIMVRGGSSSENPTTVPGNWTGSKTVSIKLKDGDTLTFSDIPAGVTYEVVESSVYSDDTDKNGENGYDAPEYTVSDAAKTVEAMDQDTVKITNCKDTDIDTGVSTEDLPYMISLAAVAMGAILLVVRRRHAVN